jgi:hypothetical protein
MRNGAGGKMEENLIKREGTTKHTKNTKKRTTDGTDVTDQGRSHELIYSDRFLTSFIRITNSSNCARRKDLPMAKARSRSGSCRSETRRTERSGGRKMMGRGRVICSILG